MADDFNTLDRWDITATSVTVAGNTISGAQDPIVPTDHGLIGWSAPIQYSLSGSLLSLEAGAGVLKLVRIRRVPTASITNVLIWVATAGASLTAGQCFAALYTAAGALIGQSADQAAAWQSTGLKTMALASGPFTVSAGDLYVGLWYNGTTAPTLSRCGPGATAAQQNIGLSAADSVCAYADTGLTTTAPATIGTKTASALHWWAAVS